MMNKLGLYLLHRNITTRKRAQRAYTTVGKTTRIYQAKPVEVGSDIHRQTVHRDAVRRTNTHCAQLLEVRTSADPHSRSTLRAMTLYAILGSEVDDTLLQCFNITSNAKTYCVEVDNRVAYKLPRAVERNIATTVYMIELRTEALQVLLRAEHILSVTALA